MLIILDPRKHAKMRWLQVRNRSNGDNLNYVRCEASRCFRNKKKDYLTAEIDELERNSKIKNIGDSYGGINDFKKGCQPTPSSGSALICAY